LRVYYADTDAGGIVYHATYLNFAERARTEMMRLFGLDHAQLRKDFGLLFAVRSCEVDYRRPARLDDLLEIVSNVTHLGGASLQITQSIRRDGDELVRLGIRLVCMHQDGRAMRIPAPIRTEMLDFLSEKAD
jgi:acyl-CoA thioester hydrolase